MLLRRSPEPVESRGAQTGQPHTSIPNRRRLVRQSHQPFSCTWSAAPPVTPPLPQHRRLVNQGHQPFSCTYSPGSPAPAERRRVSAAARLPSHTSEPSTHNGRLHVGAMHKPPPHSQPQEDSNEQAAQMALTCRDHRCRDLPRLHRVSCRSDDRRRDPLFPCNLHPSQRSCLPAWGQPTFCPMAPISWA